MTNELSSGTPQRSVFITDASSSVGRATVHAFVSAGWRAVGTTHQGTIGANLIRAAGGIPVYMDLARASEVKSAVQMAKAEAIVHLSGQRLNGPPSAPSPWKNDAGWLADSTNNLVEVAGQVGVNRVIYVSMAFLYGDTHGEWVDESAELNDDHDLFPEALYAESAVMDGGVPGVILRAGYVYDGYSEALESLRDMIRAGKGIPGGHGYANWVFSTDLANAALRAVDYVFSEGSVAEIFNVVDDHPANADAFLDQLAVGMGAMRPGDLGYFARYIQDMAQKHQLHQSLKVKNQRAKDSLGWSPRFPSYKEGLEQALLTWRAAEGAAV